METIDKQFSSTELNISNQSKGYLLEAAKWANFLAIVGFVGLGLMVLLGLVVMLLGTSMPGFSAGGAQIGVLGIIYLVMAAIYFFPTLYLYRFAQKMKVALNSTSQDNLELGFENLKSFYKFIGIFMIVIISIYVLAFIIGIIGASLS